MLRILFLLISISASLYARQSSANLSSTEGDPDGIIANCVNVITGDYCEAAQDLIIKGPDLLTLDRFFNSTNYITGKEPGCWRIFPQRYLIIGQDQNSKKCTIENNLYHWVYGFTGERSGGILTYSGWRKKDGCTKDSLKIDASKDAIGMVNTYAKEIGGQTNHKNNSVSCSGESCELVLGDGTKRWYRKVKSLPSDIFGEELVQSIAEKVEAPEYYLLDKERLPSGNIIIFTYDQENHLQKIELKNKTELR